MYASLSLSLSLLPALFCCSLICSFATMQEDEETRAAAAASADEAERLAKEKEALAKRVKNLANNMRFYERACREEEIPLITAWFDNKIAREREDYEMRVAVRPSPFSLSLSLSLSLARQRSLTPACAFVFARTARQGAPQVSPREAA